MSRKKAAKLVEKSARSRATGRQQVAIEGACSVGGRAKEFVLVTDLGTRGCRMRAGAVGMTRSEPLLLWLGEFGPVAGKLMWAKGGALGVAFDTPLDEDTVEALAESGAPQSNVVPLRA
jgi:hypothetical protein